MYKNRIYKTVAFGLSILIMLNVFCGCTFSKKMEANFSPVGNEDAYYYGEVNYDLNTITIERGIIGSDGGNGDFQSQIYSFDDTCLLKKIADFGYENWFSCINSNFAIVILKSDRMHYNRLYKHLAEQLIYLNANTHQAEVLYESAACEIIIYGTLDYVLLYHAEDNVYRYISLEDGSIIREIASKINPWRGKYYFDISEIENNFKMYKSRIRSSDALIDSYSLSP